jgi:predicted transposase/invertase (TIGR01784 family)
MICDDPVQRELNRVRRRSERDRAHDLAVAWDEGVAEGKIEVARKFLELGVKVEKIVQSTGLSREEIESLR